jgi:hypothetical protein
MCGPGSSVGIASDYGLDGAGSNPSEATLPPVQTGPGTHPAFCKMGTGSFPGVKCRVLLEQLTGLQLVKKFPSFHGTRRFISALTSVRQLSILVQSIYPHPTSWRSILILSTHLSLGLHSGFLSLRFPHQDPTHTPSPHPHAPHAQSIPFFSILLPAQYWVRSTNHLAPRYAISSIPPLPRPS